VLPLHAEMVLRTSTEVKGCRSGSG
jgi:hypothetical protein